jgi:hypothetical protein
MVIETNPAICRATPNTIGVELDEKIQVRH